MKYIFLFTILLLLPKISCFSQEIIGSSSIYLKFTEEEKSIKYFWVEKRHTGVEYEGKLEDKLLISLKNRQKINFYWKWINPLKYQISWKDSSIVDGRYEEVDKYLSRVQSLLIPQSILNPSQGEKDITVLMPDISVTETIQRNGGSVEVNFPVKIPVNIKNNNINLMYITIISLKDELDTVDIKVLNKLTEEVQTFNDDCFDDKQNILKKHITDLFAITSAEEARNTVKNMEVTIKADSSETSGDNEKINLHEKIFSKLELKNKLVEYQMGFYLNAAISDARKIQEKNMNLINSIKPIITTVKNSLSDYTIDPRVKDNKEYLITKSSSFSTGKKNQSKLSIQKYDFDEEKFEFNKSGDPLTKEFTIEKYNFIYPTFSTGIFYSTSSINYLGLTNVEDSEDFEIIEEKIEKYSPSLAAFMNFNFDLRSDFFSPFIQIGIDPTKNRPYIFSGIGLMVPVSKFAISVGGVWIFDQQLKTLNIGDKVTSTTDLEKDISYTLNPKPKGFYIGIQYAF